MMRTCAGMGGDVGRYVRRYVEHYGLAAAVVLTLVASGCREDKQAARREADQAPVKIASTPAELLPEGVLERAQTALAERGYDAGWRPGALDEPTSAALARFQKARGLPSTGVPDRKTLEALGVELDDAR